MGGLTPKPPLPTPLGGDIYSALKEQLTRGQGTSLFTGTWSKQHV